jgi:chaperonin GroES
MAVNIIPLHDYVLVKRAEEKETTRGGIIIPDTAKEKPGEADVIAVGPGLREKGELAPLDVKVGDRILLGKYDGHDIKYDDVEYTLIKEKDIWAKLGSAAKAAGGKK